MCFRCQMIRIHRLHLRAICASSEQNELSPAAPKLGRERANQIMSLHMRLSSQQNYLSYSLEGDYRHARLDEAYRLQFSPQNRHSAIGSDLDQGVAYSSHPVCRCSLSNKHTHLVRLSVLRDTDIARRDSSSCISGNGCRTHRATLAYAQQASPIGDVLRTGIWHWLSRWMSVRILIKTNFNPSPYTTSATLRGTR
jgi:hypothetical protein